MILRRKRLGYGTYKFILEGYILIKLYIAGAMSANNILKMLENIHRGIDLGSEVLKLGFAPFVPHLDIMFKIVKGRELNIPLEYYYNYTMEFLKCCDALLVCPYSEHSKGTQAEIKMAQKLNIPIFYSLGELRQYYSKVGRG